MFNIIMVVNDKGHVINCRNVLSHTGIQYCGMVLFRMLVNDVQTIQVGALICDKLKYRFQKHFSY